MIRKLLQLKLNVLFIMILLVGFFIFGSTLASFDIFPFGQGYYLSIKGILLPANYLKDLCQNHIDNFRFYGDVAKHNFTAPKIFLGDSLVSGIRDNDFFPKMSYRPIGSSGMVNECLSNILNDVLFLKPKKILLYIGGNDADGQGRQTPQESINSLKQFVVKLQENNIEVIIHGINYAAQNRDKQFVQELNEGYEETAKELQVKYIPPFDKLDFQDETVENNPLTYSGEHLKYEGYLVWFSHINQHLSDFNADMPYHLPS